METNGTPRGNGGGGSGYGEEEEHGPLAMALLLPPLPSLVSRLRNGREAQVLLDLDSIAASFDSLYRAFIALANASHHLQGAWDQLWLAQDPSVVKAIPVIAREMSRLNWARAKLMERMDCQLRLLHSCADALRHFVEVNATLAEELRMEGVERLAVDKELLMEMERGIELRVRRVLEGSFDVSGEP
uniref:Uncharacterized protein n=1 Tax=Physcomitrium patens TaxID=3218 RepID=A0A2K1IB93_PHYPA|nr:hypothetical protein PHYPA_030026 [Physcomitrium patens]